MRKETGVGESGGAQYAMEENPLTNRTMSTRATASAWSWVPHPLWCSSPPDFLGDNIARTFAEPQGWEALRGVHHRFPRFLYRKSGRRMKRATGGVTRAIRTEESMGRMMVHDKDVCELSLFILARAGMREERTRPITSSMTAALMSTVPIRLFCRFPASADRVDIPTGVDDELIARSGANWTDHRVVKAQSLCRLALVVLEVASLHEFGQHRRIVPLLQTHRCCRKTRIGLL